MGDNAISNDSGSVSSIEQRRLVEAADANTTLEPPAGEKKISQKSPPVPPYVSVRSLEGESPRELHRRILLEAASQAGLDGTPQQKKFVEMFLGGLKYREGDPSPQDDATVKPAEIKNQSFNYRLETEEIIALRQLQKDYAAQGGQFREGKVYDYSADGRTLTPSEKRNGRRGITAEQYEQWRLQDLMRKAQILPSGFGTPSRLRDLKHITLDAPRDGNPVTEDRALRLYIQSRFGAANGGNLWGDKLNEIFELAKSRGVRIENLDLENGKIGFDLSVENLLKLQHAYIGVQEKFNADMEIVNKTVDNLAHNRFAKGVLEGAWESLKANWNAITNPIETLKSVYEAAKTLGNLGLELAQMQPEERAKLFADLAKAGIKGLAEMPPGDAAEYLGKAVGALAVEIALGKGAGLVFRALSLTKFGASLANRTRILGGEIKQTIGKIPVPTNASVKIVVDTTGNRMIFPDFELTKLEDLIKPLESRAQQALSGTKKAVNLPAWEKLTFKLDDDGSIHLLSGHKVGGNRLKSSQSAGGRKDVFPEWMSDKQILKAVEQAYRSGKKVGTQIDFATGDKIIELVGYSDDGLKIRIYVNVTKKQLDTAFPQK